MTLNELLKDSAYKLSQFNNQQIQTLEQNIILKDIRGKLTPYITCLKRGKEIKLTPEEIVRQLYLMVLIHDLNYTKDRIEVEYAVTFGRETKRADICIFDKDNTTAPYILIELKKPKLKDGKEQLKSYCNATGAPIGVWTNGDAISYYQRKDPNYFEDIPALPNANEKLSDILSERWTIDDLIKHDKLVNEKKSLKDLILEMEDEVLANAGVDVFEELFKLIFTKLYDEMESGRDKKRHLVFRNYGDTETDNKIKIQALFDKAKSKWEGVFTEDAKIQLTPSHLAVCLASLEGVKLFNSNLDVVDEAFEYLINKSSKGEKGQYFTPRYVIDMCVKMLNPQVHEYLIDTAAGSCGFPVHGIFHVWEQIMKQEGLNKSHLFTTETKSARCIDYVKEKVFAIDFDEKAVRVGRTLNLIAGDGQTNVLHLNTLDYERWDEKTKDEDWLDIYGEGWKKLKKLRAIKDDNRDFHFDVLMANPPFAGDIKESRILAKYELGKKENGKYQTNVGRDILFIERNLNFLRAGGRMAVVLPQGRFNNSSDKQIREYIAGHCRILAVVGLHGNVFKPHTGTKTSVLFVQKWHDIHCPKVEDYPIFFATMTEPSKDNSGDKIYVMKEDGTPLLDEHGHLIVKHDLFNHDGLTQDGIAEAFIEFAKKENLSFFDLDLSGFKNLKGLDNANLDLRGFKNLGGLYTQPFNEAKYKALLERLEISEILFSKAISITGEKRWDSHYYQKCFLENEKTIHRLETVKFSSLAHFIKKGIFDLPPENYIETGVPLIRTSEIKNPTVDFSSTVFISNEINADNFKTELKPYDLVFTKIGAYIGDVALLPATYEKYNFSQNVTGVSIIDKKLGAYLLAFFLSKLGKNQILRSVMLSGQGKLELEDIRNYDIPVISDNLKEKFNEILLLKESLQFEALNKYTQAETLLLNTLGMENFTPSQENINIKSFKHSFLETGRLDAEYYQPKYEELTKKIKNYCPSGIQNLGFGLQYSTVTPEYWNDDKTYRSPNLSLDSKSEMLSFENNRNSIVSTIGETEKTAKAVLLQQNYQRLIDLVTIQKSIETGSDVYSDDENGLPYLRVADYNKFGISEPQKKLNPRFVAENLKKLNDLKPKAETILFSKDGSVGEAYCLHNDADFITSGAILHLNVKDKTKILPDYLTLVLNSVLVKMQAERDAGGSIILHWRISEIENVLIPIIDLETQTQIAALIQKSFKLKADSEALLNKAKRAVELAIETDEQTAMNYLGIQTHEFGFL